MTKIGLRAIKTAIAVFICALIYIILRAIDDAVGSDFHFSYVLYSPFFAGIGTAYSLHSDKKSSVRQAKNRIVASLIGGFIGIILVIVYELIAGKDTWPHVFHDDVTAVNFIVPYILVGILTIVVIHTAVILNQRGAAFVAVLTFISVTLNPNDKISAQYGEWLFGLNRILSTIIGVLVALGVNLFPIPHRTRNKDLLFCVGIEEILKNDSDTFKGYMNYKMNNLSYVGAHCTFFTTRIPSTFMPLLNDIDISDPVICFSGAAIYDPKSFEYLYTVKLEDDVRAELEELFKPLNVSPFKNYIIDNVHHIYNDNINNLGEELYKASRKNKAYSCFDEVDCSLMGEFIYYLLVEEKSIIEKLKQQIENGPLNEKVVVQVYDYFDTNDDLVSELKYAKIYSKKILDLEGLKEYAKEHDYRIVGLAATPLSNHLLKNSEYRVTYSANEEAASYSDIVIDSSKSYDDLFKTMHRMYYSKKYSKKAE